MMYRIWNTMKGQRHIAAGSKSIYYKWEDADAALIE